MERNPVKEPQTGDLWDDNYFGETINCMTHEINLVAPSGITYFRDGQRTNERAIKYSTFRHYCKWRWSFGGNIKKENK